MRFESGRHRIAEKITWDKHVVAAGWLTWDAGSIPAASTILDHQSGGDYLNLFISASFTRQTLVSRLNVSRSIVLNPFESNR